MSGSALFFSINGSTQGKFILSLPLSLIYLCVQARTCVSMTLLMKKLDHLNDEIQGAQRANSPHTAEEQPSSAVSQIH